jgi:tetratricopeptide (TPR) repeat protein
MELGEELRVRLTNLVGLEILYEKALYPELEYIFKHALTQEVAYESLLKQRRQEIHGRIARAIEGLYAHRLEPHYELLAHHYERSGNAEKAVQYLILAGGKSWENRAAQAAYEFNAKAFKVAEGAKLSLDPGTASLAHFRKGAASFETGNIDEALEELGKAAEISRRHGLVEIEKDSLAFLATTVMISSMKGEEALRFFEQAIARARDLGQKGTEIMILSSQGLYLCVLGHLYEGYQMMVEAEGLARSAQDQVAILTNRTLLALSERWLGRPKKAVELTEGFVEVLRSIFGVNYLPTVIWIRGLALAETGRIEEAMPLFREGIEICEKSGSIFYLVRLYNCLGYCYNETYNPKKAWDWNARSEETARKLMSQYPMGRQMAAEVVAQASVNLMENLFDQGNSDGAWDRIKSLETESRGDDFARLRDFWYGRMDDLASQILLQRDDVAKAEAIISKNLEKSRREHMRKNEGRFLRLLGEVQMKRKESDNAIRSLNEAILILKEVGNPRQLWQGHASLASAYDKLRRESEAREQWAAAAELIHKTANGLSDRNLREGFLYAKPIRDILAKAGS